MVKRRSGTADTHLMRGGPEQRIEERYAHTTGEIRPNMGNRTEQQRVSRPNVGNRTEQQRVSHKLIHTWGQNAGRRVEKKQKKTRNLPGEIRTSAEKSAFSVSCNWKALKRIDRLKSSSTKCSPNGNPFFMSSRFTMVLLPSK